jgi:hypothetical protein
MKSKCFRYRGRITTKKHAATTTPKNAAINPLYGGQLKIVPNRITRLNRRKTKIRQLKTFFIATTQSVSYRRKQRKRRKSVCLFQKTIFINLVFFCEISHRFFLRKCPIFPEQNPSLPSFASVKTSIHRYIRNPIIGAIASKSVSL